MAFWDRASRTVSRADAFTREAMALSDSGFVDSLRIPDWMDWVGVSADAAMQVPAFARSTKLITGTVAQLPLLTWRDSVVVEGTGLLRQPEADKPAWVTKQNTVRDLMHYGWAYWLVRDVDSSGYPTRVRVLPAVEVAPSLSKPRTHVAWDGRDFPISHPAGPGTAVGSVMVFEGFRDGVLKEGGPTLSLAMALDAAAKRYADVPLPSIALKNTGADLTPAQVQELLTAWEEARANRSTAYLSSVVDTETFGFSPAEMTLTEARNFCAVEIARLCNLDPAMVGATQSGSSVTYTNRLDLRKDLVDFTLSDYMVPIEERLSMRDVTPTFSNNLVRFSTVDFLRANLPERVAIVTALLAHPGVMTEAEARDFLRDSPTKGGPS